MTKIDQLINHIFDLQIKEDNTTYNRGMFKTQRLHRYLKYKREDSNVFYSALIPFTIQPLLKDLSSDQQKIMHTIIDGVRSNYHLYESVSLPDAYNFYQTNPSKHYPNGFILSKFDHFKLADDADVTVILNLTKDSVNKDQIQNIRSYLFKFANINHKQISHFLPKYNNLAAYATWFGSGRMPIEFDLCVMANILYFTFKFNCELNASDLDSLQYITRAILEKDVYNYPFYISFTYPNASVMLYHIARLCTVMDKPEAHLPVGEIISGLRMNLFKTQNLLEKILLSSALLKMGVETESISYEIDDLKESFKSFSFFLAPMLSGTDLRLLNYLAKFDIFQIQFVCDAYYLTLALEYELLKKRVHIS